MALTKIDDRGLKTPIDLLDNEKIRFGTGNDLEMYHNGAHNYVYAATTGQNVTIGAKSGYINLQPVDNEEGIIVKNNGAVELFYDNAKKFETTADGCKIPNVDFQFVGVNASRTIYFDASINGFRWNDSAVAYFGSGQDLQIFHNGSDSKITNSTGGLLIQNSGTGNIHLEPATNENGILIKPNGAVELFYDNSKKLKTTSTGVGILGSLSVESDSQKVTVGGGNDLEIYHDGTSSYISNTTGNLYIEAKAGETAIQIIPDGATDLRHNGSKKLETTSAGVTVTGTVTDSTGYSLRKIPRDAKTGSYTLQATDGGKFIPNSTGGWTIPNSTMNIGDVVTLINDSGSDQTIVQGTNHTIYNTADGTTGNRILAARGMATLIWLNNSVCYISGAGLS